jgi:hypothetical protein
MKMNSLVHASLATAVFLLAGTWAVAQNATSPKNPPPHQPTSAHATGLPNQSPHSSTIAVDHAGGNGVQRMDGGPAADTQTGTKSLGTAHATEKLDAGHVTAAAAADSDAKAGTNPPPAANDKTITHPKAGSSQIQPYKDPEDMTTRYRPGNNKTTKLNPNAKPKSTAPSPN